MMLITREQAIQKLKHYCAYQERCHQEVRNKLFEVGAVKRDHDHIISTLIEENYLNEERFAVSYAGGKWRIKRWGRNRIRQELKSRGVTDYCIRKALKEIPEGEYRGTLATLVEKKWEELRKDQPIMRKKKALDFFTRRGFETSIVLELLNG
jgi:regulatory protein